MIHKYSTLTQLFTISLIVSLFQRQELERIEEALPEPPDHFLDPILNTIMLDPVALPSSVEMHRINSVRSLVILALYSYFRNIRMDA